MLTRVLFFINYPFNSILLFSPSYQQGYFDEDSMEEFIASETEESSMSLTSEDEKPKRFEMNPHSCLAIVSYLYYYD